MPEAVQVEAAGRTEEQRADRERTTIREYAESLLVTVILALFGTTFIVQAFKIPSQSMEQTLLVGDHLLVNKFIFGGRGAWYEKILPYRPIRRADIIVFKFPFDDHPHYVKRVIGIPGDRVKVLDQQVYVNGQRLQEPYVVHDNGALYDTFGTNFPPTTRHFVQSNVRPEWRDTILDYVQGDELVVPPNKFFALGDNRDHSLDSRYWGFVDREAIMGCPILIYWSVQATSSDYSDRGTMNRIIGLVDTLVHLPVRTRWHRMFREVH